MDNFQNGRQKAEKEISDKFGNSFSIMDKGSKKIKLDSGNDIVVSWKSKDGKDEKKSFSDKQKALDYARNNLKISGATNIKIVG